MLTDPLALRGAATALTSTASEVRRFHAELSGSLSEVRWSAPAADVIRRGLASAGSGALTGAGSLEAGASHLRAVATAVEDLRDATRRLYDRADADLRAEIDRAASPVAAAGARAALDRLKGPDDPSWAAVAGARPVALPVTVRVREPAVPSSPTGLVDADLDGVRRLGDRTRSTASAIGAACASVHARVGALGLEALDAYGLAGSRSAQWLQAGVAPGAPLGSAPPRWALAARQCDLLVRLLAGADRPQELLADPWLADALDVLAAQLAGPAALRAALTAVTPAERAWLVDVVPDLVAVPPPRAVAAPSAARGRHHGFALPFVGPLDIAEVAHDVWQGLTDIAEDFERGVADLARSARALAREARSLVGAAAEAQREAAHDALIAARALRLRGAPWRRLARLSRLPGWLRALMEPLGHGAVLRQISRAAAGFAVVGVIVEVLQGGSVRAAVVKAVVLLAVAVAVGAAIGAGVAAASAGLSVSAAVAVEFGLGLLASLAATAIYDRYAPVVWSWLTGLVGAASRGASSAAGRLREAARGAERALDREAARISVVLGHLGHLATGHPGDAGRAFAGGRPARALPSRPDAARWAPLWRPVAAAGAAVSAAGGLAGRAGAAAGPAGTARRAMPVQDL